MSEKTRARGMGRIGVLTSGGALILQGVEGGRGWSMTITGKTGRMALSASGERVGFIVFGGCTPFP